MHSLLCFLLGVVCAWATKRKNGPDSLGWWRAAAGAAGGLFPQLDNVFSFVGSAFWLKHQYAETWSIVLLPLYALGLSYVFGYFLGRTRGNNREWHHFFLPVFAAMTMSVFFGLLTSGGVMAFAPLVDWRLTGDVLYDFDLFIFLILMVAVLGGVALHGFRRDVARVALVILLGYVVVVATFKIKATDFADTYADAMKLDVIEQHTLPQPLSPFHWRLILETRDNRLHDTLIHLFLTDERVVRDDSTRVWRIASLYKPREKAVWRIYNRFGRRNPDFVRAAWLSKENSDYRWFSRFAVVQDLVNHDNATCARMKDLRFEGARRGELGQYLICQMRQGWALYQAQPDGAPVRLE